MRGKRVVICCRQRSLNSCDSAGGQRQGSVRPLKRYGTHPKADLLFKSGHFANAEKLYRKVPTSKQAVRRLGYIAFLSNRLEEVRKWLKKAIQLEPKNTSAKLLLAEAHYRQDDFSKAAALLGSARRKIRTEQLESFKGQTAYDIQNEKPHTVVKFVIKDPLPLVKLNVNGSKEVLFLIDTGGAELILDKEFAKEVQAKQFGSKIRTFAGGKKAPVIHGRIDSLTLDDFHIKNLPVHIMKTHSFPVSSAAGVSTAFQAPWCCITICQRWTTPETNSF